MVAFELLIAALDSEDPVAAGDAGRLLGELGNARAIPALLRYAKQNVYYYKTAAIFSLGSLAKNASAATRKKVAATLRGLIEQPNVHDDWYWYCCRAVRASAAIALLMFGDDRGATFLQELAKKNDEVFFAWFAPAILQLDKKSPAVKSLQKRITVKALVNSGKHSTRNTEPGLVMMKAEALGLIGGADAGQALMELTQFQSRYVRGQAVISLLKMAASAKHLARARKLAKSDKTDFVRIKASLALAVAGITGASDYLMKAAASAEDVMDRAAALDALGELGRREFARTIKHQLPHKDAYVRQCALAALKQVDAAAAHTAAKQAMKDPHERVRLQAAKILADDLQTVSGAGR